jgi:hypothetical protein
MRNDFTPIQNAMNALVDAVVSMHASLLARANAERKELLDLYTRMRETEADLVDLGKMIGETRQKLEVVEEVAVDHGMLVRDAIYGGLDFVPTCDYEHFVGFCDECGATLSDEIPFEDTVDGALCLDCALGEDEPNDEAVATVAEENVEEADEVTPASI